MNRKQFLKTINELQGDDKNLFILSCGLMNNNNIQSVDDLQKTLGIVFTQDETVTMNKYMFKVSTICRITGENLFSYLSDEYVKLMKQKIR